MPSLKRFLSFCKMPLEAGGWCSSWRRKWCLEKYRLRLTQTLQLFHFHFPKSTFSPKLFHFLIFTDCFTCSPKLSHSSTFSNPNFNFHFKTLSLSLLSSNISNTSDAHFTDHFLTFPLFHFHIFWIFTLTFTFWTFTQLHWLGCFYFQLRPPRPPHTSTSDTSAMALPSSSPFLIFLFWFFIPGGDELVGVGGEGVHPLGDEGEVGEQQGGGAGEQQDHGQVVGEQHQGGGGADEQEEKEGENPGWHYFFFFFQSSASVTFTSVTFTSVAFILNEKLFSATFHRSTWFHWH